MKTRKFPIRFAFPVFAAALLTGSARAQTGGVIPITTNAPVVTIEATDPFASETGPDPGTFEVRRSAGTNSPLLVFYAIGGTAINGLDYQMISNTVLIPAGAWSSSITITPIDDNLVEGNETVVLRLFPSPLLSLIGVYRVGYPSNALVTIADNDLPPGTNIPPVVRIGYPTNGTMFLAPANIPIFAEAHDLDGFVTTVEFFEGTNSLGIATNNPLVLSPINPFHVFWNNVSAGDYVLTAVATDDGGATATSDPVKITVQPMPELPVVNIVATKPDGTEFALLPCELTFPPCLIADRFDPAVFTVWRTGSTGTPLVVFYDVAGTASNGVDYFFLPGAVTIPDGASSATIEVVPIDDPDDVPPVLTKTVELTLQPPICPAIVPTPPGCYVVGPSNQAVAYIHEDNPDTNLPPAVVTIVATDPNAAETGPDPGAFTVSRTGDTNNSLVVFYFTSGSAINGLDYQTLSNYVVIPAGASSADIVVTPIDDMIEEGDETVVLQLRPAILLLGGVTSLNDPTFPLPIIWPPPYIVGYPSNAVVTIADSFDGGTNLPPVVNIVATKPDASEVRPNFPFMGIPQVFDPAVFTVWRTGDTGTPLVIFYDVGGTASNGVDYWLLPGTVTIPEGANSATIRVFPIDDADVVPADPTKTVVLTLQPPICPDIVPPPPGCYVVGPSNQAVAYIHEEALPETNAPVVTIVATDPNAAETGPDPGTFTVSRTGGTNNSLAVFYFTSGSAINGVDYQTLSNYVVIPAGASSADIVVTPIEDFIEEGDETVVLQLRPATLPLLAPLVYDPTILDTLFWPPFYVIGYPSNAVVTIEDSFDGGTNLPPVVNIVARDPFASEGTNFWGTNTATFVVRRNDGTNTDLTVFYDIGGTASNGVDYVALPGSVTIPAGRHSARIVVVPLDDADNELIETVVLKLREPDPPVVPPPYLIGFPGKAAAFILDTDQLRPPCQMLSDGLFHLCQPGTNGFCFRIEATSNLVDWVPVCTNIVTDAAIHFVDPDAASFGHRFYRVLPEANLPPD